MYASLQRTVQGHKNAVSLYYDFIWEHKPFKSPYKTEDKNRCLFLKVHRYFNYNVNFPSEHDRQTYILRLSYSGYIGLRYLHRKFQPSGRAAAKIKLLKAQLTDRQTDGHFKL